MSLIFLFYKNILTKFSQITVYSCYSGEKYDVTNPFCSELIKVDTIVTRGVSHTMYHALTQADILLDECMALWGPGIAAPSMQFF